MLKNLTKNCVLKEIEDKMEKIIDLAETFLSDDF